MPPHVRCNKVSPAVLLILLCMWLPGVHPGKVFFIGFNKTGSHTLWKLMLSLGINACHDRNWTGASRFGHIPYFERNARCQAFLDGERPTFRWLEGKFPGSLFVLNTRPLESWLVSRQAYFRDLTSKKLFTSEVHHMLSSTPADVRRWIEYREVFHTRALRHFLDAETSTRVTTSGPVMADTGVIFRHVNPHAPHGPLSLFMVVDLITDGEEVVRSQLKVLLREGGIVPMAQWSEDGANHGTPNNGAGNGNTDVGFGDGVGGSERYEGNPETIAKSKICIASILDSLGLTTEERGADLVTGRGPRLPPLPYGFNEPRCFFKV